AGTAPAVYPAVAFRRAGHGLVGAILFPPAQAPPRLLAQAVRHVARPHARGPRLSVDPPVVRARGEWPSTRLAARAGDASFELVQIRADLWEGRLPDTVDGTAVVTLPDTGAVAVASLPSPRELAALGVDREALRRIAAATGGREIREAADLRALPPPTASGPRPGRPVFLIAAIVLFFAELAVATFWKP
ncbi:MAG TPA: hypothetical protein VEJ18_04405, partial [Planctomycetota bacterium]|nr:hypothetical protein [Planctomycetota bacterium]